MRVRPDGQGHVQWLSRLQYTSDHALTHTIHKNLEGQRSAALEVLGESIESGNVGDQEDRLVVTRVFRGEVEVRVAREQQAFSRVLAFEPTREVSGEQIEALLNQLAKELLLSGEVPVDRGGSDTGPTRHAGHGEPACTHRAEVLEGGAQDDLPGFAVPLAGPISQMLMHINSFLQGPSSVFLMLGLLLIYGSALVGLLT